MNVPIRWRVLQYLGLVLLLMFLSFPVYYMVVTSLKTPGEAFRLPPTLWPENPTFDAYPFVVKSWNYWRSLFNTLFVAGSAAILATLVGSIAAYGFSRLMFTGKNILYMTLIATIAIPPMVTLGPIFLAYNQLRLLDTQVGLILVFMAEAIPLCFLIMFAYLKSIPKELDEASQIDGSTMFDTMFRIILPIAAPGLAVAFLLVFIMGWNEFLFAFTLTMSPDTRMLTVRLFEVPVRTDAQNIPYDLIAAGGVLILLPLLPVIIFVQRQLVEGIMAGAIKE
jgi:ABC-type glycerol-3-phosphate transport system permease component